MNVLRAVQVGTATAILVAIGIAGAPTASSVGPLNYQATLAGTNEVPPNVSAATGTATLTLSADETHVSATVTYSGLVAGSTAAHIHVAPAGSPGPVVIPLSGATGVTSGSFQVVDAAVTPTQVTDLRSGTWYVNVHSTTYPGGEIRGQFTAVPESPTPPPAVTCGGKPATIVGTDAGETLVGTSAADVVAAAGGDDKVNGLGGDDIICGDAGNDVVRGNGGKDRLIGGDGRDICKGGGGRDTARTCERVKNL